jgi:hypothetical protein
MLRVRRWSKAVDIDRGQLVRRRLKDVAVVMELHEVAPVGRRAAAATSSRRERLNQRITRRRTCSVSTNRST